jgi:hypothetical protein
VAMFQDEISESSDRRVCVIFVVVICVSSLLLSTNAAL